MSEENKQVSTEAPAKAEATTVQPTNPTQPTGIQIGDLQTVLNIIDLASQRGAFKANELTQVGSIADKLSTFLGQVAKQAKDKADAEAKAQGEQAPATAEAPAKAEAPATAEAPSKE
jgi:hypothetical protein